jgi:hypothetical protein
MLQQAPLQKFHLSAATLFRPFLCGLQSFPEKDILIFECLVFLLVGGDEGFCGFECGVPDCALAFEVGNVLPVD